MHQRTWVSKFADAFRGLGLGIRGQSSFYVHLPMAVAVVAMAVLCNVSRTEWCLLVLCVAIVWAAELFNSAIESLARAITREQHPEIGRALDIASAAVLVVAIGAAVVGLMIFASHLMTKVGIAVICN